MAIYRLSAKTGTRQGGQSARAKIDYLSRGGRYDRSGDRVLHIESGNMPSWATAGRTERLRLAAGAYWTAADDHERANGRLFKQLLVALPRELELDDQITLVRRFAERCASVPGGSLPFTLTVHEGKGTNPHADIVLSERINDGHDRSPETWFKRAAASPKGRPVDPSSGGAPKSDHLKPEAWLLWAREAWAGYVNAALEDAGVDARVDHRSLEDQGIDRDPEPTLGPQATGYERRMAAAGRPTPSRRRVAIEAADSPAPLYIRRRRERRALEAGDDAYRARVNAARTRAREAQADLDAVDAARRRELRKAVHELSVPRCYVESPDQARWREWRERALSARYGDEVRGTHLARYWHVDAQAGRPLVLTTRRGERVEDQGGRVTGAQGTDHEIDAMLELARLKGWQTVRFGGGDASFRERAIRAAIAAGFSVLPTEDADFQRIADASREIGQGSRPRVR